jgi:hypothetical protein
MAEGMGFVACVYGLDDDDLEARDGSAVRVPLFSAFELRMPSLLNLSFEEPREAMSSWEMGANSAGISRAYLLAGISTARNDGNSADLEKLHRVLPCQGDEVVVVMEFRGGR